MTVQSARSDVQDSNVAISERAAAAVKSLDIRCQFVYCTNSRADHNPRSQASRRRGQHRCRGLAYQLNRIDTALVGDREQFGEKVSVVANEAV